MSYWAPRPSPLRYILLLALLVCAALAVYLWVHLSARAALVTYDPGVFLFGLALFLDLALAGMLAYLAWCASTIGYRLERDHLFIRCGGLRYVVPLTAIRAVHPPGEQVSGRPVTVRWRRATALLPGYVVGGGHSPQLGRVLSVATVPASEQVFVTTRGLTFGISPHDPASFVRRLNEQRDRSMALEEDPVAAELTGPSAWGAALWSDPLARALLLAGLALSIPFFGYLSLVYGNLPDNLALHWNAQGEVDRIGDPIELLRLPAIALGLWLANALAAWWAHRRERAVTLFLLAGAIAVQLVFATGALSIVLRAA